MKVCAYCGKQEGKNWLRHCKDRHQGSKKEWDGKSDLIETQWCENWVEVLDGAKPLNIHPSFKPGFKQGNKLHEKKSKAGSTSDGYSAYQESHYNESQFAPEEEIQNGGQVQNSNQEEIQILEEAKNEFVASQPLPPQVKSSSKSVTYSMLGKRESYKLDEPSLKEMESSCDKVEAMFKQQKKNDFQVPLPIVHTEYIHQGMRDQEAIDKLRLLDNNKTGSVLVQVPELIELSSFFSQAYVAAFIEQSKLELTHIKDILLQAQLIIKKFTVEQISSVAFASFLFGGSTWAGLPKMFESLDSNKLNEVLFRFAFSLSTKLDNNLANWVRLNWRYLEEQTLPLMRYLKEMRVVHQSALDIATISTVVVVKNVTEYLTVTKVFLQVPVSQIVLSAIKVSAPKWLSEQKLSFIEFASLVNFLLQNDNDSLIELRSADLSVLPLHQWMDKLKEWNESLKFVSASSIQERLNKLQQQYGKLSLKSYATDLCVTDPRYKQLFAEYSNTEPNALQFANSQYAALMLRTFPRQLWCIPSGQGKSRVLATIALILLLVGSTTKIHMVFDSEHLMKRDNAWFATWWTVFGCDKFIEYHVGLDFECQPGEVILIDEADELIFSNPAEFQAKIQQFHCICLTATPDNSKENGVERQVLKLLGFSIFNGQLNLDFKQTNSELKAVETLDIPVGPELVLFIQKKLQDQTVLCYCTLEFQQLLAAASIMFTLMKDGEDINDEFLRTLDNRTGPEGTYPLIVASGSFGMRGFDYRAKTTGITLVLAESFSTYRSAIQGLNRVGRFGDPGKRYIAAGVELIDRQKELLSTAPLMQFLNSNQKQRVVAHLLKEEKKKAITTANTAKSTPAVGKSKKTKPEQQQQQNSNSQTTLTMIPRQSLTRRQTQLLVGDLPIKTIPTPAGPKEERTNSQILFGDKVPEEKEEEDRIEITPSQIFTQ